MHQNLRRADNNVQSLNSGFRKYEHLVQQENSGISYSLELNDHNYKQNTKTTNGKMLNNHLRPNHLRFHLS